jgi:hypothetical protein
MFTELKNDGHPSINQKILVRKKLKTRNRLLMLWMN